ncbi:MAG: hypothetical protein WCS03_00830 [Bacteroidota bacterium]
MEIKHFSFATTESSRFVKIIRIIFGLVCISVAVFWLVFNIKSFKTDGMLWITIIFLSGFGFYQIWSGLGLATKFIEIGTDYIRLKKNPVLPHKAITAQEIERIELFPMNMIFFLKSGKRIMLRFGALYQDRNKNIKDEIIIFADINKIPYEIIVEKL